VAQNHVHLEASVVALLNNLVPLPDNLVIN
jgi:hypothetical protein